VCSFFLAQDEHLWIRVAMERRALARREVHGDHRYVGADPFSERLEQWHFDLLRCDPFKETESTPRIHRCGASSYDLNDVAPASAA
jgi:hypothetical protein